MEADGAVDTQNAPTVPWKTLCVFHELPQGLSNQITHEKPRKAPKWRWETRIDPKKRYAEVLVCDEAHRTAQIKQITNKQLAERVRNFTLCHDQAAFPARYRLYQTATPKVYSAENTRVQRLDRTRYTVADMNDHKIFGPTGYRRSYVHAVENDLLTDYRIIAFAVDEKMWIAAERIRITVDEKRASQKKRQVQLTVTEAVGWLVYGIVLYGGAPEATDGKGIVRLTLRPAQCRDEHSPAPLPSASLSARNHQPCRLALPQILHELPGC